jgi:hypothetical protein
MLEEKNGHMPHNARFSGKVGQKSSSRFHFGRSTKYEITTPVSPRKAKAPALAFKFMTSVMPALT